MRRDRAKPDGCGTACAACERERARAYHAADREAGREYARAYRTANLEAVRERDRAYKVANREVLRARDRTRRTRNAARTDVEVAADRARLRPDGLRRCRKCRERLPFTAYSTDRTTADGLRNDCRACDGAGLLRIALPAWAEADTWACVYCGAPYEHSDHVWPASNGGPDDPRNLVPACARCNLSKNGADVLDFVARHPALGAEVLAIVSRWHWVVVDLDAA